MTVCGCKHWGGSLDLDQHDHRGHDRDGRSRVHHDAQRAMVGVAVERMHVRHLDHGQQRQQGKTHNGDQPAKRLALARPILREMCLKSCSTEATPVFKNTQNWMHAERGLGYGITRCLCCIGLANAGSPRSSKLLSNE